MCACVLVEGNIGSGKSTFLRYLENDFNFKVFLEPLDKWLNFNGFNPLAEYYSNPAINSLAFQIFAAQSLFERDQLAANEKVVILERSIQSSRNVFGKYAAEKNYLNSFQHCCLNNYLDDLLARSSLRPDLIIYLRATPEVLFDRIRTRGRIEEQNITIDHLQRLNELHESFLDSCGIPNFIFDQNPSAGNYNYLCAHKIMEIIDKK